MSSEEIDNKVDKTEGIESKFDDLNSLDLDNLDLDDLDNIDLDSIDIDDLDDSEVPEDSDGDEDGDNELDDEIDIEDEDGFLGDTEGLDEIELDEDEDEDSDLDDDLNLDDLELDDLDGLEDADSFDDEKLENKEPKADDADNDGSLLDRDSLMKEDSGSEYEVVQKDAEFIDDKGEFVVMDPSDNEDNFKLIYVDIENIAIVKRIRETTSVEDLVKSIKSTGLLKPVDVAPTSADGIYVLLDGYRRIMACARAGKRRIPCVVNTRVSVPEIPILEAMYNHSKKYSIKEIIKYIDYLEKEKGIMSASMIEYLLQMNSGDYTKLKDILNDDDDDIVTKLMNGQYNIETAFKKLEQRRKKESAEEKELKKAAKVYDTNTEETGAEDIADSGEVAEGAELTDDEIKNLAINAKDLDNVDDENLEDMVKEGEEVPGFQPHKQDPKCRERLDPALRKAVLARDNNTCQICKQISGMEFTEVLDVHHIQEVYLGGNDDIDNLVTACTVCHKLIHLYGRGQLNMRPIEEMSEVEQARFKRIVKLGTIIRKGMALRGMKLEQLKKVDNAETIGRTKPGEDQVAG